MDCPIFQTGEISAHVCNVSKLVRRAYTQGSLEAESLFPLFHMEIGGGPPKDRRSTRGR